MLVRRGKKHIVIEHDMVRRGQLTGLVVVTLGMREFPGGILEVARRERTHRLAP
ncbi:hypothetical protein [Dyella jejuensis]